MWSFKKTWTKLIVYLPVGVSCSSKMKMCAFWPYLLQKYYAFSHVHLPHNHQHQWSVPLNHWCSPRDQGLGLEAPRGQKLKSWSWIMKSILVLNIWSWSRSWRKSLAVFKTFLVILDGSEQGTPWHFVWDNKSCLPFGSHCLREPSTLHAHQPQLSGYLTMGLFVRLHRRQ